MYDEEIIDGITYKIAYLGHIYSIDNNLYAGSLSEAVEVASNGSTIKLLRNYEDLLQATINKNITFDLQTFTLTRKKKTIINSETEVTITGSTGSKIGGEVTELIVNQGTLIINGSITIENNKNNAIRNYTILVVNNGTIKSNGNSEEGIYNDGAVTINGGTVIGKAYGIFNSEGTVTVNNGLITSDKGYGIFSRRGTLNIGNAASELNTTNPCIIGKTYGVYMQQTR